MGELVGLSFSMCVKDIIEGKVKEEEVMEVIARTAIHDEESLKHVLSIYSHRYWYTNPDEGKAVARRLWNAGKIKQPRVDIEFCPPTMHERYWILDGLLINLR